MVESFMYRLNVITLGCEPIHNFPSESISILSTPELKSIASIKSRLFVLISREKIDNLFPSVSAIYKIEPSLLILIPFAKPNPEAATLKSFPS